MKSFTHQETHKVALIDGKEVSFDFASSIEFQTLEEAKRSLQKVARYIGTGTIHSIDNVRQSFNFEYYFFLKH